MVGEGGGGREGQGGLVLRRGREREGERDIYREVVGRGRV